MANEASEIRAREARAVTSTGIGKETSEQSRARAEARIRQIRGNPDLQNGGGERDKYWAPDPPEGFDYQWKRRTVMGQEDVEHVRQTQMNGWEPVPLSRHPEMMPRGWQGSTIEVDGQVLMERPSLFTEEARKEELRVAREAVMTKEQQMRETRANDLGRRTASVSKSRAPIDVPE